MAAVIARLYLLILVVAIGLSYLSFDVATRLKLDTNITSLMPDGVPSVNNLERVIKKTGGYSSAMVLVQSPDPDAAIAFLDAVRARVRDFDWVSGAEYSEDTSIFERNRLLYLQVEDLIDIERRLDARIDHEKKNLRFTVETTPVEITIRGADRRSPPKLEFDDIEAKYSGERASAGERRLFRNDAGDLTILVVLPEGSTTDVSYSRRILRDLREVVAEVNPTVFHPAMTVEIGGRVLYRVAQFDAVINDVRGSALWSLSGILLVLVLFYRRLSAIFYIGLPLVAGFLWTFAITQLVLGSLNLITVFLVLILFGLGVDFGIHNLARYDEVRRRGGNLGAALGMVMTRTGQASLLAAVTTVAGFFSLMFTDFRAFYEFGFIAGTGVALSLVSMYLVFPALMVLAERLRIYRPSRPRGVDRPEARRPFRASTGLAAAGAISAFLGGAAVFGLQFEEDFSNLSAEVPELKKIKRQERQVFPLRSDKAVVFVETLEDVKAVVDVVEGIRTSRMGDEVTIDKVKSIYSIVPESEEQRRRLKVIDRVQGKLGEALRLLEEFGDDPQRKAEIEGLIKHFGVSELKPENLPVGMQRIYTGIPGSGGYLVYIYNRRGTGNLDRAQAFVDDIREIRANGKTFYPATEAMVFVDMLNLMKKDAVKAVAVVLLAIMLVLWLAYRRLSTVALVTLPVVLGLLWMLALMAVFDIRLSIFNMVVLPTVLGIGIDNGIHIFHRFQEEGGCNVAHVVGTTGGAAFLTTLTTMLGFAGMLTASSQGLQSLGLVACLGLGCCMVSSLTVFPAVLEKIARRPEQDAAV